MSKPRNAIDHMNEVAWKPFVASATIAPGTLMLMNNSLALVVANYTSGDRSLRTMCFMSSHAGLIVVPSMTGTGTFDAERIVITPGP